MALLSSKVKWVLAIFTLLFLLFFVSKAPWNYFWVTFIGIAFVLLLADYMFISGDPLELDPFYSNYENRRDLDAKYK